MANLAYQVTSFAYQGIGAFAYQGSTDDGPVAVEIPTLGANNWTGEYRQTRKKRKVRIIKYSDYESQEAYARALAEQAMPIAAIQEHKAIQADEAPDEQYIDDDDTIIKLLFLTKTIQ